MTFSEELAKPASERYSLVKISGARNITSLVSSEGGSIYSYSFDRQVSDVTFNGVSGTRVTDTPDSDKEWNYNESSGVLTIFSTTAPSASNYLVMSFNLFFTNHFSNVKTTTGSDSDDAVIYENRLVNAPSMSQNVSNNIYGLVSVSQSDLEIVNENSFIQGYMTSNDSFYNKEVSSWIVVNGVESRLIRGIITAVRFSPDTNTMKFSLTDKFGLSLSKLPNFGDAFDEAFMLEGDTYTNIRPEHQGFVVPVVYGKESSARWGGGYIDYLPIAKDIRGVITDQTTLKGRNYDNKWAVCRIPNGESLYANNLNLTDSGRTVLQHATGKCSLITISLSTAQPYEDVQVGDAVTFDVAGASGATDAGGKDNTGNPYHGVIVRTNGDFNGVEVITVLCDYANGTSLGAISSLQIVAAPSCIYRVGASTYLGVPGYHFDTTTEALTNNTLVSVGFNNNATSRAVEVLNSGSLSFDVSADTGVTVTDGASSVHSLVRVDSQQGQKHEVYLEDLVTATGISVNSSSFSTAGSALASRVFVEVPYPDDSTLKAVSRYAQDLLTSTGGILFYKPSTDELHYKLLDTLSTGSFTVKEADMIQGSFSTRVEYRDIRKQIVSTNGLFPNLVPIDGLSLGKQVTKDDLVEYLHGATSSLEVNHVLEDFTVGNRDEDILNLFSGPVVKHKFSMYVDALQFDVGDTIIVEHSGLVGGVASQNCLILGYTRSQDKTTITCSPLREL